MTSARLILALLVASLALVATACGGGSDSVPTGSVAVVNGTEISKAELQEYMELSKKGYERTNQTFPKAGTPEYQSVQARNLAYLVELVQLQQAAEDLGVKVTDADVDKLENQTIKSKFDGDRAEYEKALKKAGYTSEQYRRTAYTYAVLSSKIFDAVTKDVEVTDQDDPRLLHREPVPVRHARVARGPAHPHPGEEQGRVHGLRGQQAEGRRGVRAAGGRSRLRHPREAALGRPRQREGRRQADDHARPDRARVRQGGVRARHERALEAGQDDLSATTSSSLSQTSRRRRSSRSTR